jgi:hypothetical protein
MNNLYLKKLSLFVFILLLVLSSCNSRLFHKNGSRNAERELFGKSLGRKKEVKVKEPRAVLKAKKKQEANDRKLKSDYKKSVKKSQERTIDIQTPEVQVRMKQNRKDTDTRDKSKRKKAKTSSKKAGRKYN